MVWIVIRIKEGGELNEMDHEVKMNMLSEIDSIRALLKELKPVEVPSAPVVPGKRIMHIF